MEFEGAEYRRDYTGYFRCPWQCVDPKFSKHSRKFKGEEKFRAHLEGCKAKPEAVQKWKPEPEGPRTKYGSCPDCGGLIWNGESIWWMPDRIVCIDCHEEYLEAGVGHHDCAGLILPDDALEG